MSKSVNWYPGHMFKAKKEIQTQLKVIDIVIEVIDSRVPLSSHNKMLTEMTKNKTKLLVFSKSDLVENRELQKYVQLYEKQGFQTYIANLKNSNERKKLLLQIEKTAFDIKRKYEKKNMSKTIRVLIIGMPNVGKSTLINHLINKNKVKIANKPGVTKQQQWVKINDYLELLDTPGIMVPKVEKIEDGYNLVLSSLIKEEVVPLDDVCVHLVGFLKKNHRQVFYNRYKIEDGEYELVEIFDIIGKNIGAVFKGGDTDYERVIKTLINDYRKQKFGDIILDELK